MTVTEANLTGLTSDAGAGAGAGNTAPFGLKDFNEPNGAAFLPSRTRICSPALGR